MALVLLCPRPCPVVLALMLPVLIMFVNAALLKPWTHHGAIDHDKLIAIAVSVAFCIAVIVLGVMRGSGGDATRVAARIVARVALRDCVAGDFAPSLDIAVAPAPCLGPFLALTSVRASATRPALPRRMMVDHGHACAPRSRRRWQQKWGVEELVEGDTLSRHRAEQAVEQRRTRVGERWSRRRRGRVGAYGSRWQYEAPAPTLEMLQDVAVQLHDIASSAEERVLPRA